MFEKLVSVIDLVRNLTTVRGSCCTLLFGEVIRFKRDFKFMCGYNGFFRSAVLGLLYLLEFGLVNGFADVEVVLSTLLLPRTLIMSQLRPRKYLYESLGWVPMLS